MHDEKMGRVMSRENSPAPGGRQGRPGLARPVFLAATLLTLAGDFAFGSPPSEVAAPPAEVYRTGQVLDGRTGKPVSFEAWLAGLAAQDVIYLGEEHRNRHHIAAALTLLRALAAGSRKPVLALEMFGWDGQAGLDRYLTDRAMPRERFLEESRWEQNWGGAFEDYEPLVAFARDTGAPVLALNPPRAVVRLVAKRGLAQAGTDPELARWGLEAEAPVEDPEYRRVIFDQIRRCHEGLPEEAYQRLYEASLLRDEGMAKTIAAALERAAPGSGPIVSYTGGGHVQRGLPVPHRVRRRRAGAVRQVTVYLTALTPDRTEEIATLLRDGVADYLWLTPVGDHGPPRRCR